MAKAKKHYVDTDVLEANWTLWLDTGDNAAWRALLLDVYKICEGVAVHFNPRDEDEHLELTHEAFTLTVAKIESRKLRFDPGRAPVFNLLTTTIMRQLYSLMNKYTRRRRLHEKFKQKVVEEKFPEARSLLAKGH